MNGGISENEDMIGKMDTSIEEYANFKTFLIEIIQEIWDTTKNQICWIMLITALFVTVRIWK